MVEVGASIALKWFVSETYTDRADALLDAVRRTRDRLIAPELLAFELTNALYRRVARNGLSLIHAANALATFQSIPITISHAPLHREALQLAGRYGLVAAYDAQYIALAQVHGCNFWTTDERLLNSLRSRLPFVCWIGDFTGAL
ncbi:MAG: type II toxin-antitoxin system VapC family toxin [Dehalococcoidia bacterium]